MLLCKAGKMPGGLSDALDFVSCCHGLDKKSQPSKVPSLPILFEVLGLHCSRAVPLNVWRGLRNQSLENFRHRLRMISGKRLLRSRHNYAVQQLDNLSWCCCSTYVLGLP